MTAVTSESMQNAVFYNTSTNTIVGPSLTNLNVAGYGPAIVSVTSLPPGITLPVNGVIGFKFASSYPPPIYSVASASAALRFTLFTNDNAELITTGITNRVTAPLDGFNGVYYQPGEAESYSIIMKNTGTAAIAAGSALLYIQATIQNTLGQFLPSGNIVLTNSHTNEEIRAGKAPTTMSIIPIVTFNSISAVPNCYAIKVENFPVRAGSPVCPINIKPLKTTNMLIAVSNTPNQMIAPSGGYNDQSVIANSTIAISTNLVSAVDGTWSGSIFVGFTNVGTTTQIDTITFEVALPPFDSMLKAEESGLYKLNEGTVSTFNNQISGTEDYSSLKAKICELAGALNYLTELVKDHLNRDTADYPRRSSAIRFGRTG